MRGTPKMRRRSGYGYGHGPVPEPLEPRVLFSTLLVNGTAGDDTITLGVTSAGGIRTDVNGDVHEYAPGQWTDVVVNAEMGTDAVAVKGTVVPSLIRYAQNVVVNVGSTDGVQGIKATLTINGAVPGPVRPESASVTIDDSGDAAGRSVALIANSGQIETIAGLAPADVSFSRVNPFDSATASATGDSLTVITGSGDDNVKVQGLLPDLPTAIRNSGGKDAINVGAGSLANIQSDVSIGAFRAGLDAGHTGLTIDDSADKASAQFTLDAAFPVGPADDPFGTVAFQLGSNAAASHSVRFDAVDTTALTLKDGSAGNSFAVNNTAVPTTLALGGANDQVLVVATSSGAPLQISGGPGKDTLSIQSFGFNINGDITFDGGGNGSTGDTLAVAGPPQLPAGMEITTPLITVTAGNVTRGNNAIHYSNIENLRLQNGDFRVENDLGPIDLSLGAPVLPVPGDPTAVEFDASQHLGSLELFQASATVTSGGDKRIDTGSLTLAGSHLDLTNNALQVHYGTGDPFALIRQWIFGKQLASSSADDRHNLGYADSADGVIKGLSDHTVLVKYALYGDANLDGKVNFDDLVLLAANYRRSDANWDQGDFNYDGRVDFADLVLLARNYGQTA